MEISEFFNILMTMIMSGMTTIQNGLSAEEAQSMMDWLVKSLFNMPGWAQATLLCAAIAPPAYAGTKRAITSFQYLSYYIFRPIIDWIVIAAETLRNMNEYAYPAKMKKKIANTSDKVIQESHIGGFNKLYITWIAKQKRLLEKFLKYRDV